MAIYTHLEVPGSPSTPWFSVDILYAGEIVFDSGQTLVTFANADGSVTRLHGSGFHWEGNKAGGQVASMSRTDASGAVTYETITDLNVRLARFVVAGANITTAIPDIFHGDDTLTGWSREDFLLNGAGADALNGNGGVDFADYRFASGNVLADLADNTANLGEAFHDTYTSIEGLVGSDFGDRLRGDSGVNRLFGGDGVDILMGRGGADLHHGGEGVDWVDYIGAAAPVTVNLVTGFGSGGDAEGDTFFSIENVRGGEGNDTIVANAGVNALNGGGGEDTADYRSAAAGLTADLLFPANNTGDAEGDTYTSIERLRGSAFDDQLFGDNAGSGTEGGDWLEGGAGADLLNGRGGFDYASYLGAAGGVHASLAVPASNTGEAAGDSYVSIEGLIGTRFADHLTGDSADNIIMGGRFNTYETGAEDVIDGGAGFDMLSFQDRTELQGAWASLKGNNQGVFTSGDVYISMEGIIGTEFRDNLEGDANANILRGEGGDDTLDGGGGLDTLIGGSGNDNYRVFAVGATVVEQENGGIDGIDTTSTSMSLVDLPNVENLGFFTSGEPLDATLTGNMLANEIWGWSGNDIIDGREGADTMVGQGGNDTYYVDNYYDAIVEGGDGGGIDSVFSSASIRLGPNVENVTLTGNASLSAFGNARANEMRGNNAWNTLDGKGGADLLTGMLGNDTYFVDNNGDRVIEGVNGGIDTVRASYEQYYFLPDNVENLIYTGTGNFYGYGKGENNTIIGGDGNDGLDGGGGNDILMGGGGNDSLGGGIGNDLLDGGSGADYLSGTVGNDTYRVDNAGDIVIETVDGGTDEVISSISYTLGSYTENLTLIGTGNGTGNKFANVLTGSDSANTLDGLFGADRLTGGGGNDTLTGGRDADIFVFKPGFGHDTITDFQPLAANHDILEFDASMFADAAALFAHSADTAEGVLVTFDTADTLLLKGATLAQLAAHPEDFHFV